MMICEECKTPFITNRKNQRFCSLKCSSESRKRWTELICQHCSEKFKIKPWLLKQGSGKYCSLKCYYKSGKCGVRKENPKITEHQRQIILGSLLGDMSLHKPETGLNYHFSIYHSIKQQDYLKWKFEQFKPLCNEIEWSNQFDKRFNKSFRGGRISSISFPYFTELRELCYPDGKKTITPEWLEQINDPIALIIWIGDDGSWASGGIEIATCGFGVEQTAILCQWLNSYWGIESSPLPFCKNRIRIKNRGLYKLKSLFNGQILPKGIEYKFGGILT